SWGTGSSQRNSSGSVSGPGSGTRKGLSAPVGSRMHFDPSLAAATPVPSAAGAEPDGTSGPQVGVDAHDALTRSRHASRPIRRAASHGRPDGAARAVMRRALRSWASTRCDFRYGPFARPFQREPVIERM